MSGVRCTAVACALALVLTLPAVAQASFSVGDVAVTEANGPVTATFTIARQAAFLAPEATLNFTTVDVTAHAPADYVAATGGVTFPAGGLGGAQYAQVAITVKGDALDEPGETFRLRVAGGAGEAITRAEGTAVITDDDPAPVVNAEDAASVAEGAGGTTATFTFRLSTPSGRDVSVDYATIDGTAVAGHDYDARSGTVQIPTGTTTATVAVPVTDDDHAEGAEVFGMRLSAASPATIGRAVAGTVILDDDSATATSPGTGTPAGAGAAATLAGGTRLGLGGLRMSTPRRARMRVTCPAPAGRCEGRVSLFTRALKTSKIAALRSERTLGRRRFEIRGGRSVVIEMKLGRAGRRLLARAGRLLVRAYAVAEDTTGRAGTRSMNGTLTAPRVRRP